MTLDSTRAREANKRWKEIHSPDSSSGEWKQFRRLVLTRSRLRVARIWRKTADRRLEKSLSFELSGESISGEPGQRRIHLLHSFMNLAVSIFCGLFVLVLPVFAQNSTTKVSFVQIKLSELESQIERDTEKRSFELV